MLTLSPVLKVLAVSGILCLLRVGSTSTTYILGFLEKFSSKTFKNFLKLSRACKVIVIAGNPQKIEKNKR